MHVLADLSSFGHISYVMAAVWILLMTSGGANLVEARARRRRQALTYIARG